MKTVAAIGTTRRNTPEITPIVTLQLIRAATSQPLGGVESPQPIPQRHARTTLDERLRRASQHGCPRGALTL
jgi:hypothetical protein